MIAHKDEKYILIEDKWLKVTVEKLKNDKVKRYVILNDEKKYLTDQEMKKASKENKICYK